MVGRFGEVAYMGDVYLCKRQAVLVDDIRKADELLPFKAVFSFLLVRIHE
jgi:hypothetical protein